MMINVLNRQRGGMGSAKRRGGPGRGGGGRSNRGGRRSRIVEDEDDTTGKPFPCDRKYNINYCLHFSVHSSYVLSLLFCFQR